MKLIVCALALVALTQASNVIDLSKVMPRHVLPVLPDKYYNVLSQKIMGGHEAVPNSIPYQVALDITVFDESYYCGGSLISTRYVLTAASCFFGEDISVEVILGAHRIQYIEETQVTVTTTKITIHPEYNYRLHLNDIAVVELPSEVQLNDYIKLVDLPTWADAANDFTGVNARFSGWGQDYGQVTGVSEVLRYVFADVITNSECSTLYGSDITDSQICTSGSGDVGICIGDEGGPLVADGKQIGILVNFKGCSSVIIRPTDTPTLCTRITHYLDWIAQNTDIVIKE